ncbi:MAG: 50S ribosomal protein L25 [Candidatus Nealsonbacteria bacterium]|nr:50S ribosomal protein L25 [Candidatus Nealsonbacteria bacterium]
MLEINANIRKEAGRKTKKLRKKGVLPAVVYGSKMKPVSLEVESKSFGKTYSKAKGSSLVSLKIEGKKEKYLVLIHDFQKDPLTGKFIHVDFYQPSLKEKIQIKIPLVFEGESEAVKSLGGTLIKNIAELEVRALPENLPHEIKVNIGKIKTFEDHIKISDLEIPENVEILKNLGEIVASVVPLAKVEEELEKPIEEKIEEIEKVEKKKETEELETEEEKKEKKEEKKEEKSQKNKQ